ncbi:MAG TPA: glycosyltransferase family 39 protein [Bryobacteraceae bacterium]|nr:glycosyltransferase family 39 protein [Bryobacteraceae bacterium]
MRKGSGSGALPASLFIVALIFASTVGFLTPRLTNAAIDDGLRTLEDAPFPFIAQTSVPVREYQVTGEIARKPYQFRRITLLPAGCLASVAIDGRPAAGPPTNRAASQGYELALPEGPPIRIHAKIRSDSEMFGLSVAPPAGDPLVLALRLMAGAALAGGLYFSLRRWFSRAVSLILLGALPVQLVYLSHTPATERAYDVLGHLQYIEFVTYHVSLPPSAFCFECYQPGLYYVLAAPVYALARAAGIFDPFVALQYFALAWFWVFLIVAARIARLWLPRRRDELLAAALLAFWPGGFLESVRVSNDLPLYACFAICLYFLLRWWNTGTGRDLSIAASVAACGILIKAAMAVAMGAIGILALYRMFSQRGESQPWRPYLGPISVMAAGVVAYGVLNLVKAGEQAHNWRALYLGEAWKGLAPSMYVGNSWKQYLTLDGSYFRVPFVDSVATGTGKEYFWNYVLKSSMFGDYHWFRKPVERVLAFVMSPLLLGMAALFGAGVVRSLRASARQSLPLLVVTCLLFLALFLHRFLTPYSANNDFRFIYPALIPMVLLFVEGTRGLAAGRGLALAFCALSAAFYLSV